MQRASLPRPRHAPSEAQHKGRMRSGRLPTCDHCRLPSVPRLSVEAIPCKPLSPPIPHTPQDRQALASLARAVDRSRTTGPFFWALARILQREQRTRKQCSPGPRGSKLASAVLHCVFDKGRKLWAVGNGNGKLLVHRYCGF